ncbi:MULTISPECIES: hypothetical protein [unclassified Janthinobacterium]|uniref:hypothetical protein n=1 Tax=unclassified Janthinobacterium TaxID=2610881 RepID=UPI00160ECF5A|nr:MULTISPECIES: hypothetical protein [unclassified Janthinobacterium]MBB5610566.1 putative HTH transcriptional regulator [Janthinobacterium sp. S3T4]MBB5615980.1 putative HTH transcriptional regulator [Janthinobacterium sp. S3M3]
MNAFEHFIAQQDVMAARGGGRPKRAAVFTGVRADSSTEVSALELVKENPDIAVGDIATALGVESESLYPVLQRLRRSGKIVSAGRCTRGNKWRAV